MLKRLLGKLSRLPDETYRAVSKEFLESQMPIGRQIYCLVCDRLPASKISLLSQEKLNSLDWRIEHLEVKTIKQLNDEQKKEAEDRAEWMKQQDWAKGLFIPFKSIDEEKTHTAVSATGCGA